VPRAPPPERANAVAPYASLATPKRLRQTFVRSSSEHVDESQSTDAATCVRASVAARSEPARNRKRKHSRHREMETKRTGRRRAPERVLPQHLILLKIGSTPPALRGTYTIAKPPRLARATRGLSHDHDDGVTVSWRRHRPDVKFKFNDDAESRTLS